MKELKIQVFVERYYWKPYQILRHRNQNEAPQLIYEFM